MKDKKLLIEATTTLMVGDKYFLPGSIVEMDESEANRLVKENYAIIVENPTKKAPSTNKKPKEISLDPSK